MKKCIVIGGGFAGLSTAVFLANNNFKVRLIEASPKLGGRAYSLLAKDGKTVIDNGQHILMGCYSETIKFLKLINADKNFQYQSNLKINFLKTGGNKVTLKAFPIPYPFSLLLGIMNYQAISFRDRIKVIGFILKILKLKDNLNNLTVSDLLKSEKQNDRINKALWEVIAIGALNTNINKASAEIFRTIIKEIFSKGNFSSAIILPEYGLTESYIADTVNFIKDHAGTISTSYTVTGCEVENNRIRKLITTNEIITDFDYVISALPFYSFEKVFDTTLLMKQPQFEYSSILTVHVWLRKNSFTEKFYGLIDSPLHWIFNKNTHITLVISDADYLIERSKEEIFNLIKAELNKFAGIQQDDIKDFQVIKEKRATFIPSVAVQNTRPPVTTKLSNLFIAGDWIDTGLPSTIESAVKSSRMVSEVICKLN